MTLSERPDGDAMRQEIARLSHKVPTLSAASQSMNRAAAHQRHKTAMIR